MEFIYKIYSVLLYDNQLNHDYIILNNNESKYGNLSYGLKMALDKIYSKSGDPIELIRCACEKENMPFIKNNDILTIKQVSVTHLPNYNGYDIYWNESKSGINPLDYKTMIIWNSGNSSVSEYRIQEYKEFRDKELRKYKLFKLSDIL